MSKDKTSSFVLTLPIKTETWQEHILDKKFEVCRKIYNAILSQAVIRYNRIIINQDYIRAKEELKETNKRYRETTDENIKKQLSKQRKNLYTQINKLLSQYGLTEYSLHEYVKPMYNHFGINSHIGQTLATRAYNTVKKMLDGEAKKVNFIKYGELKSIEGKSNKQAIIFKDNIVKFNKIKIAAIIKPKDYYAKEALTHRIKYCRFKREIINGKTKYYVQLILEGKPPVKVNRETGEMKNVVGSGKVGIDIGTQTVAISSSQEVKLLELAPNVVKIDKDIKRLQRKLDRIRRKNNPGNYNEDGTIKKGIVVNGKREKLKWKNSKRYKKTRMKLKELHRKQREIRKLDHNIMANWLIGLGDDIKVETMNFKALQKRSKKTKQDKNGKFKSKKRFGKSLAKKAPSTFISTIKRKLNYHSLELGEINTREVKASQYNHLNHQYNKKKLSQRWNDLEYGNKQIRVQRDLYSAFLVMCVDDNMCEVNNKLCEQYFDGFLVLHDKEIGRLSGSNNISSMGV